MSWGDKLRRLGAIQGEKQSREQPTVPATPVSFNSRAFLDALPGFEAINTEHGTVFRKHTVYGPDYRRGNLTLHTALHVATAAWNILLSQETQLADIRMAEAVFIDTETTGLGRGSGTYAFLIGIGRFTDDGFIVRQYIMPDYDHEAAMIHAVANEINVASLVFTFNGKSFDGPLLQTRAIMNGLRLRLPPHIDLYHLSRRFFASKAQNCSLGQLEIDILQTVRHGDVPGYMIPSLYFDFLAGGDAARLAPICNHNALDILSTAGLAGYMGAAVQSPFTATPGGQPLDGADLYAVGQLHWQRNNEAEALRCFEEARVRPHSPGVANGIYQALTTLYKRHGRYEAAVALWHDMVSAGTLMTTALVELAKYYEHERRDYAQALAYTQRCIDYMAQYERLPRTRAPVPAHGRAGLQDALHHRRQRLEKRLRRELSETIDPGDPDIL